MELNWDQLVVHDDKALERFRRTYGIPVDIQIECPGPNNVPRVVVDNVDRIPIRISLIYKPELWFPINSLLKEVMARCRLTFMHVSVNFVRTVLVVDTLMRLVEKPFSAEDLLHIYTVVWPKSDPDNPLS